MIDFHCHLDLYPDPEREARDADAAGIYLLSVTTTPKAWPKTAKLARGRNRIRTALGLHPQLAHERHSELLLFEKLLENVRYVGEIGLDGAPGFGQHASIQIQVLSRVLSMVSEQGGRILTIHSRRAVDDVLRCLGDEHAPSSILHWFSGTGRQLDRAIAMGCWFSVGPAMLASSKGRALVSKMPRDRILTETDGPFGKYAGAVLRPVDSWKAVDALASLWELSRQEIIEQLKQNLRQLALSGHGQTEIGVRETPQLLNL